MSSVFVGSWWMPLPTRAREGPSSSAGCLEMRRDILARHQSRCVDGWPSSGMADPLVRPVLELKTHTLLRIRGAGDLAGGAPVPAWVERSLQRAPWVVVRRAPNRDGL